jgi:hypothetical protein
MKRNVFVYLLLTIWLTLLPEAAEAYIGPGAGLTVIGTVVAFVSAILLGILGFVWYPLKRLMALRKLNASRSDAERAPVS